MHAFWSGTVPSWQNHSKPRARVPACGCACMNSRSVCSRTMRTPSSAPPLASIAAKRPRSWPVEKSPALPVMPPSSREKGSFVFPANGVPSSSVRVGAHASHPRPGSKRVEVIPSGVQTWSRRKAGSGRPAAFDAASPSSTNPTSE